MNDTEKVMWDRLMEWARDGWTMPDNNFLQEAILAMDDYRKELEAQLCRAREG